MKKIISVFLLVTLLIFSGCVQDDGKKQNIDDKQNIEQNTDDRQNVEQSNNFVLEPEKIISSSYYQISVFEGKLKEAENLKSEQINISIENDVWKINGKEYVSYPTVETSFGNYATWKMDFSYMMPCCRSSDFVIYSNNGKSDNDVLLVEYSNALFMLVHGDILNPYNYTTEDFVVEWFESDSDLISNIDLESLWQAHLSSDNENNINYVLSEDPFPGVRFRVKEHPELVYAFSFIEINGKFSFSPVYSLPVSSN